MVEQGSSISSKEILNHIDKAKSLNSLKTVIRNQYILKDFKSQFKKFEALIDELAKDLNKSVIIEFRDEIFVDTENIKHFLIPPSTSLEYHGSWNRDEKRKGENK